MSVIHEVMYVDDSFSTTPETTIAAIRAFDAPKTKYAVTLVNALEATKNNYL